MRTDATQADPPVLRSLAREHARLRTRLARLLDLQERARTGEPQARVRHYRQVAVAARALRRRLWVHLCQEEEVLFPIVDTIPGAGGGPTTNLRAAHIHLLEMLSGCAGAARALSLPRAPGDEALRRRLALLTHQLSQLLPEHLDQEESVLFGMVRRRVPPAALRGAVARMEALARAVRHGLTMA